MKITTFHFTKFIEIFLLFWITSSLFYDPADNYGALLHPFLNTTGKFFIILLIVASSWLDLQLAIILTIAFFILLISFNKKTIQNSRLSFKELLSPYKKHENNDPTVIAKPYESIKSVNATFQPDEVVQENSPEKICNITPYDPEAINDKLFELRRDPKFDDYDEYIRMLSTSEQIHSAQDNSV